MKAAISWSAGKDACLALLRARGQGLAVPTFVTMCDDDGTSKSHALPPALIEAQVAAFGGRCWPVRVPPGQCAASFDTTLAALRDAGHTQMVFGDIDLQAHRDGLEPACGRAGREAVFPLEDGELRSFVWNAPGFAPPLRLAAGTVRRVASVPPLVPTALVLR